MDPKERKPTKICFIYDTETCNIIKPERQEYIAYPILYIFNDVSSGSIAEYLPREHEEITFVRHEDDAIAYIDYMIEFGKDNDIIPICCIYNAMFDLLPLLSTLSSKYSLLTNAQSGTSIYTLDIVDDDGNRLLRFWDTSYLEPRGLKFMGETAGLEKAIGDWDYDKIRTPETTLTDDELYYAARDVQVIPAYLRFLLESNDHIAEEDLGTKLLTKTSLVRIYGKRITGQLTYHNGKTVLSHMYADCKRETAKDYKTYATRKASFRGGLTFSAANYASIMQHNIASLDVTSMHHAFINGRYIPCKFTWIEDDRRMHRILTKIKDTTIREVLNHYHMPFSHSFNGCIKLTNMRLKPGSVFEKEGIAILAEAKVYKNAMTEVHTTEDKRAAEESVMTAGYHDRGYNVSNYYGKIYAADVMYVYCTEIEWWCICQVYVFDSFEWISGEYTYKHVVPPDYVTLLSNVFYDQKAEMKQLIKAVERGDVIKNGRNLPLSIYDRARQGSDSIPYLEQYYQIIVKGMFNAVYGSQAQDVNKPSYKVTDHGDIIVDDQTRKTPDAFESERGGLVNYTYGSRIVAGSRMHLIIAMILLKNALGDRIRILGGDTDSLKISTDDDVTNSDLMSALTPLHLAVRRAIDHTMQRIRRNFPDQASTLDGVGEFEIEHGGARYDTGVEYWNKCRMFRIGEHFEITCAGVSRPADKFNLERIADRMLEVGFDEETIYSILIGYNTTYMPSVSFVLGHKKPAASAIFDGDVTDYTNITSPVHSHRSICLYPAAKTIGEETRETNYKNITYKKLRGDQIRTDHIYIWQDASNIYISDDYTLLYTISKK